MSTEKHHVSPNDVSEELPLCTFVPFVVRSTVFSVSSVVSRLSAQHLLRAQEHLDFFSMFRRFACLSMFVSRAHKALEQRMGLERLRFEFWMELAADEMGVIRQFDHLDIRCIRRRT